MASKSYQVLLAGSAAANDFYNDLASLRMEERNGEASRCEMQLSIRLKDNGSWTYLDDDNLALFTKLSVQIGFTSGGGLAAAPGGALGSGDSNAGMATIFDGYITGVEMQLGSDAGSAFLKVTGMDTSVLMSLEEKIASWPNMADSDIAQQIIGGYGATPQTDTTTPVHQDTDTTILQRGSDLQFVRDLAEKNGFEFYFETDASSGTVTAYFQAPQLTGTPQPDLAINAGAQSNLKSFSARMTGLRPLNVKIVQLDVSADSPNTGQASSTSLKELGASDAGMLVGGPLGSLVRPQDAPAQMLLTAPPTSDATELQNIAQAVRDEAGWFITAQGEISSDAYQAVLRPHRLVLVKGAGKSFSGKYYVTAVAHEVKADGSYTQKFEAIRNARDLDGSEQFGSSGQGVALPSV
jgi:phage protein D